MRITNSMLVNDMLWNANRNLNSLSSYQKQLSSGKSILKPSDDPVGTTRVLKYKSDIRGMEQYKDNIKTAQGWLQSTETPITTIKDILQRARELSIGAANGTNTTEDLQKTASEIESLIEELIVLGNSTNAGKYIFSGAETDKRLFNEDGTFNIDMTSQRITEMMTKSYEIATGVVIDVGVSPADLFGFIDAENFFDDYMGYSATETTAATQSTMKATVDLNRGYVSEDIVIDFGGADYKVTTADLDHSQANPMTQERFLKALKEAPAVSPATGKLSDVADVYFDAGGELVIQSKTYGNVNPITLDASSNSPGFTVNSTTTGVDGLDETITGTGTITDAAVAAETGTHTLVVEYNGVQAKLDIDFSTLNTAGDLDAAIQGQLDAVFPSGAVDVTVTDGGTLDFTIAGSNDGQTSALSVDYIQATESQMISDMQAFADALNSGDQEGVESAVGVIDEHLENVLSVLGEIGGVSNRLDFSQSRTEDNVLSFTSLLSTVYDVDMAEAIMYFKNLESIYRASLSIGGQVIQPTLVDFIK